MRKPDLEKRTKFISAVKRGVKTAASIAKSFRLSLGSVQVMLCRMEKEGYVKNTGKGIYSVTGKTVPVPAKKPAPAKLAPAKSAPVKKAVPAKRETPQAPPPVAPVLPA